MKLIESNSEIEKKCITEAKEYLQQLQKADAIIGQRIREKNELRARLSNIGSLDYSRERVRTSARGRAGYEQQIVKIVDLENEIDRLIDVYDDLRHKIIGQIHELNNADQIKVLYKRYVLCEKFEQIADDLNFSVRNVYEVHSHGLQEFRRIHLEK